MEDIGPGHLTQHGVSHCHIEPVVSARVGNLRAWVDNHSRGEGWGQNKFLGEKIRQNENF